MECIGMAQRFPPALKPNEDPHAYISAAISFLYDVQEDGLRSLIRSRLRDERKARNEKEK